MIEAAQQSKDGLQIHEKIGGKNTLQCCCHCNDGMAYFLYIFIFVLCSSMTVQCCSVATLKLSVHMARNGVNIVNMSQCVV